MSTRSGAQRTAREPSAKYIGESRRSKAVPRALLDVNVLIALLDADHLHHRRASDWMAEHIAAGWASCAITQNGCIRIMSQPAYPNALPTARVAERLRAATLTAHHRFMPDALNLLDSERFDTERLLSHRAVTDAYLLGLTVHSDLRFVTFDTAVSLQTVRGATPEHIVTL